MLSKRSKKIVVLGTGGTIAGTGSSAGGNIVYAAAQIGVVGLLAAIPALAHLHSRLVCEQVAQVDSKDMDFSVLQALAGRTHHFLADPGVSAVVITHGTDTLEETAYFLHAVLPRALLAHKPVVLTCAMRPATAMAPDGPQNLMDAFSVAQAPGAAGVLVVCAGTLHSAVTVQKVHPYRLNAFDSGEAGPLGFIEEGRLRLTLNLNFPNVSIKELAINNIVNVKLWPRVEIVVNHAGADGAIVDALVSSAQVGHGSPVRGIVVAGTGNGTVHQALHAALLRARATGVQVVLASRCAQGRVLPTPGAVWPDSKGLSPVKARIALMLSLLDNPG